MQFKLEYTFNSKVILSNQCYWKHLELSGEYTSCITRFVYTDNDKLFDAITWCYLNNIKPFLYPNHIKIYHLDGTMWNPLNLNDFKRVLYNKILDNVPIHTVNWSDVSAMTGNDTIYTSETVSVAEHTN